MPPIEGGMSHDHDGDEQEHASPNIVERPAAHRLHRSRMVGVAMALLVVMHNLRGEPFYTLRGIMRTL
jgi:hypothetical protein